MNHDSARLAIDALFAGKGRKRAELRAHLDGCLECRAVYDRTARAFRTLAGRPEEMTSEEQWLFEPELPEAPQQRSGLASYFFGGLATLATVGLLVVVSQGPPEFASRGNDAPQLEPGGRAFCVRDGAAPAEALAGACQDGDRLLFAVTGQGRGYAAVVVQAGDKAEVVVSGSTGVLPAGPETVLSQASIWRPGQRAVAVFSASPIEPADAERCAKGECAPGLEPAAVPLSPARPP
jgi:hypothetical protein